ncbi:MAG: indolepyruvate oxidoreductase subunit beta [Acutalibacteraceae bacterium]|jgi:indolepyruvate ferredoxin oxidoreductase beta subunit
MKGLIALASKSIIIAGVGGQGTLFASRLLGRVLIDLGFDVKVSEVHGMSQRGGGVVTFVKYGEKVASPVVDLGEADLILAFEPLEAARWIKHLNPEGEIVVNTRRILPMPVITGETTYPEDITGNIKKSGLKVTSIDASSLAEDAGSLKTVNVVLIGVIAAKTDFPEEAWINALKQTAQPKFFEMNLKAFEAGYNYIEK